MNYSEPNFKTIHAQHLNNLKFILGTLFLTKANHQDLSKTVLILTQRSKTGISWPWVTQVLKTLSYDHEEVLNYLLKVSKDFMDDQLARELLLMALDTSDALKVYDRLESALNSYPLVENAIIQGYAGLLCLQESRKQNSLKESLCSKALLHFEKSLKLDGLSIFENYYLEMLSKEDSKTLRKYLESSFMNRPNDLTISRALLRFYDSNSQDCGSNDQEWIHVANQELKVNPVEAYSGSLKKLVFYYETRDVKRSIEYLLDRLDYNSGEIWMWSKLVSLLKVCNYDFGDRLAWWPQMHFSPISTTLDWSQENVLVILVVACFLIAPDSYSNSLLKVKIEGYKPLMESSIILIKENITERTFLESISLF